MGQIYIGRASPFGALAAGLTADELLPPREAVDERRRRDEASVGTLAEATASYRPDPRCPGVRRTAPGGTGPLRPVSRGGAAAPAGGGLPPLTAPSSNSAARQSPSGLVHQTHEPQRARRVSDRAARRHPQDGL